MSQSKGEFLQPEHRKWWIVVTLTLGTFTISLPFYTLPLALPKMLTSLSSDLETLQWVLTGFMVTRTLLLPMVGWLGALLGNRRLFLLCFLGYTISSVLCSLAWNTPVLIFFRVVQGIVAGPITPLSVTIMYQNFPRHQQGLGVGLFLFSWSLSALFAYPVGGYLIEYLSWRALFLASLPFAVLTVILGFLVLEPGEKQRTPAFDFGGLLTLVVWLVSLMLALSQGRRLGWDAREVVILLAVAILGFLVFLWYEWRQAEPLVELHLFRNPVFASACAIGFLNLFGWQSSTLLLSLFLQQALDYTPYQASMLILPSIIVAGMVSPFVGRISDKILPPVLLVFGFGALSLVTYSLASLTVWVSQGMLVLMIAGLRFSSEFTWSPLMNGALKTLPPEQVRMGSSLLSMLMGIGGSAGIAVSATMLNQRQAVHYIALAQNQSLYPLAIEAVEERIRTYLTLAGEAIGERGIQGAALLQRELRSLAAMEAYQDGFLFLTGIFLFALLPTTLMLLTLRKRFFR
ncbi:MAG: DHA2 family efflux MFS transporter permease subunit [Nitrospinota bacterium]|nr:MAG: DHA2 family efflux MFS transporter permease subunit [Nitrospinota bacterium]